jgi:hypothetical protein
MALAKRNGKLKGKQPKLPKPARRSIPRRYAEGEVSLADLATDYTAWIMRARRNCRAYERLAAHGEAFLGWTAVTLMSRRLTRKTKLARRSPAPAPHTPLAA